MVCGAAILEKYNMKVWATVWAILKDRVFRIGHLGDFNDLQIHRCIGRALKWDCARPASHTPGVVRKLPSITSAAATADRPRKRQGSPTC